MKYIIICLVLLLPVTAICQESASTIIGTWKAISKVETETTEGAVTEEDKEIYKAGEKTYTFTATTLTISQKFGKHTEKLPIRVQGDRLFIGKMQRNKDPYVMTVSSNRLILTKTEQKQKKGKTQVETEVVTLEK